MKKYIIDEEINLSKLDLLNTKVYVDNLVTTLNNTPKDRPFTIGLFGQWGSGKSSIIKTSKEQIESNEEQNIKFITYDAWKYSKDSFRRMFLLKVQEELKFNKTGLMEKFYFNSNKETEINTTVNSKGLVIMIIFLTVVLAILNISKLDLSLKLSFSTIIPMLAIFITIIKGAFNELKLSVNKPLLFAPEQFEECFKEMAKKTLKKYTWLEKAKEFVTGNNHIKDLDKLVIVIDNIDRCHKELAYELLTNIKNFLGENLNVVFLIPVDDTALKRHITQSSNGENSEKEAEEFLRKFFNVTLRIKPFQEIEMYEFTQKLNSEYNLNYSNSTISLVSNEYATNPRRIIQFLNNLTSELNNYNKDFAQEYEAIICKFLIIREEFNNYYKLVCLNSHLINNPDDRITQLVKSNSLLKSFLEKTEAISDNIGIEIFERILSNSNVFSELPSEIKASISNFNFEKLKEFYSKNITERDVIIDFIINRLNLSTERQLKETEGINLFKLVLYINNLSELPSYNNLKLENLIKREIDFYIEKTASLSELISYSISLQKQDRNYLKRRILYNVNKNLIVDERITSKWENLFLTCLKTFEDSETFDSLNKTIVKYSSLKPFLFIETISEKKSSYLVSDELITLLVSQINSTETEDIALNNFSFLCYNTKLSSNYYEQFFERLNALYPNFRAKSNSEISNLITLLVDILEPLDNNIYSEQCDQLNAFFTKVVSNRGIPNPNFPNQPQRDSQLNYIDEIIGNPEDIEELCELLYIIYRITLNQVDVSPSFTKIINGLDDKDIAYNYILKISEMFTIPSFYDIILADKSHSSKAIQLYEIIFTQDDGKQYILEDDKLVTKLNEIVDKIIEDVEGNETLIKFLESIMHEERINPILVNYISNKPQEIILSLPYKLQFLAIDTVQQGSSIFNYINNIEFLKAVASKGKPIHIQKLVNVLISMLQKEEDLHKAVSIIKEINRLNKTDKKRIITELEKYQDSEDLKDLIEETLNFVRNLTEKLN